MAMAPPVSTDPRDRNRDCVYTYYSEGLAFTYYYCYYCVTRDRQPVGIEQTCHFICIVRVYLLVVSVRWVRQPTGGESMSPATPTGAAAVGRRSRSGVDTGRGEAARGARPDSRPLPPCGRRFLVYLLEAQPPRYARRRHHRRSASATATAAAARFCFTTSATAAVLPRGAR